MGYFDPKRSMTHEEWDLYLMQEKARMAEMINNVKFCKNCRWLVKRFLSRQMCGNPLLADKVTGKPITAAQTERSYNGSDALCGRNGKLYEENV